MASVVTAVVLFVVTILNATLLMSRLQLYNKLSVTATSSTTANRLGLKTASGAVVSSGHYPIIIGSNTLIHTGAAIIAEAGPITIGTNNIIEERAVIINRMPRGGTPSSARVIIGNNNIFNVDSHSEALKIGNNNILGPKSFVGREVELTHNCIVGPSCVMTCPELISPNSVVCGHQCT
ncbi:dynactin subunit 6 isoform X2 [Anabrus simplex]|uniref:dynactin subunit 6 isoform X2 n=1 Tax=Anabrus simplex TaxID=316456 RepID=UPI0035A30807